MICYEYTMTLSPYTTVAEKVALLAGKMILQKSDQWQRHAFSQKGSNDFVTSVDIAVNEKIVSELQKAYPQHGILSEELGRSGVKDSPYQWVVDPIDGTTNFIFSIPHYAVSIALMHKDEPIAGIVYDPIKNELFAAAQGQGAYLNGHRVRVSRQDSLNGALLGTGIPYRNTVAIDVYIDLLRSLIRGTSGIRRLGAASLDLAYVACGRLDGFWELGLRLWDIAAGVLLVREAGGLISDLNGQGNYLDSGDILAGTPVIHKEMLRRIKDAQTQNKA